MEEEIILSFCIGLVFFIIKLITIRMNKKLNREEKNEHHRMVFRDSFMISLIVFVSFFVKREFFNKSGAKTRVFTNEPGF